MDPNRDSNTRPTVFSKILALGVRLRASEAVVRLRASEAVYARLFNGTGTIDGRKCISFSHSWQRLESGIRGRRKEAQSRCRHAEWAVGGGGVCEAVTTGDAITSAPTGIKKESGSLKEESDRLNLSIILPIRCKEQESASVRVTTVTRNQAVHGRSPPPPLRLGTGRSKFRRPSHLLFLPLPSQHVRKSQRGVLGIEHDGLNMGLQCSPASRL